MSWVFASNWKRSGKDVVAHGEGCKRRFVFEVAAAAELDRQDVERIPDLRFGADELGGTTSSALPAILSVTLRASSLALIPLSSAGP